MTCALARRSCMGLCRVTAGHRGIMRNEVPDNRAGYSSEPPPDNALPKPDKGKFRR